MGEEKNIEKQLFTSFGLFFAGATPVKWDTNGKKKKAEGYQCTFNISSIFTEKGDCKKGKKTDNSDSKTMSQQCSSSPRLLLLSFLSLPCLVLLLAHPRLAFEEEGRGGGYRQRDLSASLPRPALGLTGAAEEWGQPQGLTQCSLDPGYSMTSHACEWMCVWRLGGKDRVLESI